VTHSRWFKQPLLSTARTPKRSVGGFPASGSLRGSFMVGHQCVFDRGGGTRIPPSQHHEEEASPRVAALSLPLRFIPSGSPTCCTRLSRRFGSCPPAAPSGSVVILPEPPVDNSATERRGSEKGGMRTGHEFIGGGHDYRRPHSALNMDRRWSINRSAGVSTKTQAQNCPPKRGRSIGHPRFLYVADCKLCTRATLRAIHRAQGRFVTILPQTRKEDGQFRKWLGSHSPEWQEVASSPGAAEAGSCRRHPCGGFIVP